MAVEPSVEPPRKKACIQSTLPVLQTGAREHSHLNIQLRKFIIAANCPFSLVEDEEFVKFIDLLRPGTRLPTSQTISGPAFGRRVQH